MFQVRVCRQLLIVLLVLGASAAQAADDNWRYDGVDRIVAVSDIHGDYEALHKTLRNAGIIDDRESWSGGTAHLVIVGDMLDRGAEARAVMDLLMELEPQAESAGGRVHVLIGNHEAMNLVGDLRYVPRAEYAAFAGDEDSSDRDHWHEEFVARRSSADGALPDRESFDKLYPLGYFAQRKAFAADGKYGRWLLGKPIMIVIDGTAFVHGGVSPMVGEIGLDGVNGKLRGELAEYVRLLQPLYAAGALLPTDNFYEHAELLEKYVPAPDAPAGLLESIRSAIALHASAVHSPDGPLWYRGNAACSALVEADRLKASLQAIGADRVVIGHTPTGKRRVLTRYNGTVIEVDTGMNAAFYRGMGNALVIQGDSIADINEAGSGPLEVLPDPRRVGRRPAGYMDAGEIEELLAHGEITATSEEAGAKIVTVSDGERSIEGVFVRRPARNLYPDAAAYRIDRLLGLDMVPVAVRRQVDSVDGTLRFRVVGSIDEQARVDQGRNIVFQCPFAWQVDAMYLFDALINNYGRSLASIRYSLDNGQLFSVNHALAFDNHKELPPHVRDRSLAINDSWRTALEAMTDDVLSDTLGDVLGNRQIAELARRRDLLLAL